MPDRLGNTNGLSNGRVGSWDNWAIWVVKNIETQIQNQEKMKKDIGDIQRDLAVIKTKAAIIGSVTAIVLSGVLNLIIYLVK